MEYITHANQKYVRDMSEKCHCASWATSRASSSKLFSRRQKLNFWSYLTSLHSKQILSSSTFSGWVKNTSFSRFAIIPPLQPPLRVLPGTSPPHVVYSNRHSFEQPPPSLLFHTNLFRRKLCFAPLQTLNWVHDSSDGFFSSLFTLKKFTLLTTNFFIDTCSHSVLERLLAPLR